METAQEDLTGTVAKHYNELQESGLDHRVQSRIFYQRNFHNWIKSMAIASTLEKIKCNDPGQPIRALDLCSGKGGDLLKWKIGKINSLVCADIAGTSVEQCEARYKEMQERGRNERYQQKLFSAEFITADCTKQRLRDIYKDKKAEFDVVSCQFSFHYSFESLPQAEMMLQNACECLRPGGYFIGTTPNSYEMIKRLRAADGLTYGNDVYNIAFSDKTDKQNLPLFGAKYDFHLEGVVNCPEFLVYFPVLEKMAQKYDMKLVYRMPFADFFEVHKRSNEGRGLLGRMQALEPYPADQDVELMAKDPLAYNYVKDFLKDTTTDQEGGACNKPAKVGTLSQPEWEASTLYLAFAFQKNPVGTKVSDSAGQTCSETGRSEATAKKRKATDDDSSSEAVPSKLEKVDHN